jgi:hypothetical protein
MTAARAIVSLPSETAMPSGAHVKPPVDINADTFVRPATAGRSAVEGITLAADRGERPVVPTHESNQAQPDMVVLSGPALATGEPTNKGEVLPLPVDEGEPPLRRFIDIPPIESAHEQDFPSIGNDGPATFELPAENAAVVEPPTGMLDRIEDHLPLAGVGDVVAEFNPAVRIAAPANYSADDLARQLDAARLALHDWRQMGDVAVAEQRRLAAQLYRSMAQLGESLTGVAAAGTADPRFEHARVSAQELVNWIAADQETTELVEVAAPSWIGSNGPGHGVLIAGTVRGVVAGDHRVELKLETRAKQIMTLVGSDLAASNFEVGQGLLVLGILMENPRDTLIGYNGSAQEVVLIGCCERASVLRQGS